MLPDGMLGRISESEFAPPAGACIFVWAQAMPADMNSAAEPRKIERIGFLLYFACATGWPRNVFEAGK